jgi:hypothetical protein
LCRRFELTVLWLSVAGYRLTGICTSPNAIDPFQIALI